MIRQKVHVFQMLTRVVDFGAKHVGLFPDTTIAGEILGELGTSVQKLAAHSVLQEAGNTSVRTSSILQKDARRKLKKQMRAISATARALEMKGFWMPTRQSESAFVNKGHEFAEAAEPLKAAFINHGLQPTFVEDLKEALAELEGSINGRTSGKAVRSGAIREFDQILDEALRLLHRFEVLVRNSMAHNERVMAAWDIASHVEKIPKSKPEPARKEDESSKTPESSGGGAATAAATASATVTA
jgi:hypothetical protein